jgi:hypothetical protein
MAWDRHIEDYSRRPACYGSTSPMLHPLASSFTTKLNPKIGPDTLWMYRMSVILVTWTGYCPESLRPVILTIGYPGALLESCHGVPHNTPPPHA